MKNINSRASSRADKDARLCSHFISATGGGVLFLPHSLENTKMKFLYFTRFIRQ